jgi:uncharacterized protein YutE (UPF0331/DUF86 family)
MDIFAKKFELIEDSLRKLSQIKTENPSLDRYRKSWKDRDSSERNLQKIIEAFVDIGKMLISDKKLREPMNNREVFLILEEKGIFSSEFMDLVDKMIGLRNVIVHGYNRINDEIIFGILKKNLKDIERLMKNLRQICLSKK